MGKLDAVTLIWEISLFKAVVCLSQAEDLYVMVFVQKIPPKDKKINCFSVYIEAYMSLF